MDSTMADWAPCLYETYIGLYLLLNWDMDFKFCIDLILEVTTKKMELRYWKILEINLLPIKEFTSRNCKLWHIQLYSFDKITLVNKLRSFQFNFLHRIVFFNDRSFKYKLVSTTLCDFCNQATDSFDHRYFKCPVVQEFEDS